MQKKLLIQKKKPELISYHKKNQSRMSSNTLIIRNITRLFLFRWKPSNGINLIIREKNIH